MIFDNTICAPATSLGGAIGLIRVSGDKAFEITDKIFFGGKSADNGKSSPKLSETEGYRVRFGTISSAEEKIDEVLVSVFKAPHSYTGENCVEIACHGSSYIINRIIALLIENGAKMAQPGEFTQRSFVNGKMDLAQAEAVADLIASETAAAHRIAFNQLKGGFSDELAQMRGELLEIVSLMELELDFSEEDVEFADRTHLKELLDKVTSHIQTLISSFKLGNVIKNGIPVAIAGPTNAGKSTLLNAILGEERAIVSPIHGTTRDTIEDTINIGGTLFRFIDTAGIRKTKGTIESIGIERTFEKIAHSDIILMMLDGNKPDTFESSLTTLASKVNSTDQKVIILINKCEQFADNISDSVLSQAVNAGLNPLKVLQISAKNKIGLETLFETLSSIATTDTSSYGATLVTNVRHYEALQDALTPLLRVRQGLDTQLPTDLISQDLREALYYLGSIVGEISTDEILGNIFKKFCIGK